MQTDSFSTFYLFEDIVSGKEGYLNSLAEHGSGGKVNIGAYVPYSLVGASAAPETQAETTKQPICDKHPSDTQVKDAGGSTQSDDGVKISKTLDGTDVENVFDITLSVETTQNIQEFYKEPDMAVVIVMDISNTMNSKFGGTTRYGAAMAAAEEFLKKFQEASSGVSRVGFVAFNTNANKIFDF